MKTWKKIIGLTVVTGVALGALAYFAKKKSLEDDFNDDLDYDLDDFDNDIVEEPKDDNSSSDRNYVPIDLDTPEKSKDANADQKEK